MFIRPMGPVAHTTTRPQGHPLLRGLLTQAAGTTTPTTAPPEAQPLARADPDEARDEPDWGDWSEDPWPQDDTEPPTPDEPPHPANLAADLTQLSSLAREGLLTPHEFTTAKRRLLNG
ncbi:hypothetical protein [Streptomyces sp. NPDC047014]|uniref:hypothetical protein n=1 Tax=Streptomyces sp. NPDC047014 TaxID=3155736 RepID=UPI0033E91F09